MSDDGDKLVRIMTELLDRDALVNLVCDYTATLRVERARAEAAEQRLAAVREALDLNRQVIITAIWDELAAAAGAVVSTPEPPRGPLARVVSLGGLDAVSHPLVTVVLRGLTDADLPIRVGDEFTFARTAARGIPEDAE